MAWNAAPVRFGRKGTTADTAPVGLTTRQIARRANMLAEAAAVVGGGLPAPGEAVHGIMTGRYDLMHVLVAILAATPAGCDRLRIATLSYNRRNMAEMLKLLDSGKVKRLDLICSKFFREHNKALYKETAKEFGERPGRTTLAAPRSHCKVVCFEFNNGWYLVLEGSANLRTNGNWEQFAIINDRALHDWHAGWIDGLLVKHGGTENDSEEDEAEEA